MSESDRLLRLAEVEQADFVALVEGLTPEQWEAPSLCDGMSVRDILVHVSAHIHKDDGFGTAGIAMLVVRSRFSVPGVSHLYDVELRERNAWRTTANIASWLRAPIKVGGLAARMMPETRYAQHALERDILNQLSELVIHQQDVRRAIDAPRAISADRLVAVLDFTVSRAGQMIVTLRGIDDFLRSRLQGLRFVATDFDWASGEGSEVRGPGEALVMAINGRGHALADLSGPGLDDLARRVERWSAKFAYA